MATTVELPDSVMKNRKAPEDLIKKYGFLKHLSMEFMGLSLQTERTEHFDYCVLQRRIGDEVL